MQIPRFWQVRAELQLGWHLINPEGQSQTGDWALVPLNLHLMQWS